MKCRQISVLIQIFLSVSTSLATTTYQSIKLEFDTSETSAELSDFPEIAPGLKCIYIGEYNPETKRVRFGWISTGEKGAATKKVVGPLFEESELPQSLSSAGGPSADGYIFQNSWSVAKGEREDHIYFGGYLRKNRAGDILFWGQHIETFSDPKIPDDPKHPGTGGGGISENHFFAGKCELHESH